VYAGWQEVQHKATIVSDKAQQGRPPMTLVDSLADTSSRTSQK
jgi:hypothetical protein